MTKRFVSTPIHSITTATDPRKIRWPPGVRYLPSKTPIGYRVRIGALPKPLKRPPPLPQ